MPEPFTEEKREELSAELEVIERALEPIIQEIERWKPTIDAIEGLAEAAQERYGVTAVGNCECCDRLLVAGDKGHICEEGEYLCERCAPTYRDIKNQIAAHEGRDCEKGRGRLMPSVKKNKVPTYLNKPKLWTTMPPLDDYWRGPCDDGGPEDGMPRFLVRRLTNPYAAEEEVTVTVQSTAQPG